ncbi:putative RNA recognition motif domain, nucleotide-binding alpha-beta plait domain superfamily [Helianthus annuus]|uniref:RNA recognition motif domain, nucleotide-binding alpha-beta plait domain superfamily n=1 Tax=Helianthus annuus TaxID=4232 RepID=A0A9K3NM09_HELAN|nr:putative RNA recognition motif domain, nucleotide-binding alpha-beta plait domain superfamily [Helianthus annuus]KAJ0569737.1 putative RNA recognition motif domain, nucleotide-binding alpha-beta plait domain superfamily [Helianthus annuus]KAJ0584055.1 putative RNA recognition motif domain, nucleotide-binding alpha-beta plait domain superfamily [Helianthus annuus]KAJ0749720.1 putative RNA recognition motif domain, nucleotide-binding alpha-beta plait domain superfamily [Helianthus annuus]KAJ09
MIGGGENNNGGPWSSVQYRKNRKSKGDVIEWSFLVQNVSDRVTRNVLWRSFQLFGFISDAYVARKRDTRGRCFGFVRFVGVEDMKEFLVKLNTIKMFNMKVVVSLAKYDKDHKRINYAADLLGRSVWRPKVNNQDNDGQPTGQTGLKDQSVHGNGAKVVTVEGKGSLYPIHCIGRSIIGSTKTIMSVRKVRLVLDEVGLTEVGLSFVGGLTYMLTFSDKMSAARGMETYSETFHNIFSKFYLWNGEDIPYSRLATIYISGVPFVIRDNNLFDDIGGLFGSIIQPSSFSWQNEDNSNGSLGVVTSQVSRIEEAVVTKWKERTVVAWASEYIGLRLQEEEDDHMKANDDLELDSSSNSESDSDDDRADMEDIEEGEIRPIVQNESVGQDVGLEPAMGVKETGQSDDGVASPVANEQSHEGEGSPTPQKDQGINSNMGNPNLHGEEYTSAHVHCHEMDKGNLLTPDLTNYLANGPIDGGPVGSVSIEDWFNGEKQSGPNGIDGLPNQLGGDDGLTPVNCLGKRSRADRSPPSLGSIQGPSQRLFGQYEKPDSTSLDLNSPIREGSGAVEDFLDTPDVVIDDQVVHSPIGDADNPEPDPDSFGAPDAPDIQRFLREEIDATVQVGSVIGIDLNGFADVTEKLIMEEGVTNSLQ